MAEHIAAKGVHHFRLTVSNVDRSVAFYTEVLGFKKLMDLNPGAFLSNGAVGQMPSTPLEPPVRSSHWNTMAQTICAKARVSIAR